ncbi:MAG TPA: rhomboid family intramembrane serine protease [Chthonomonadales bacterium]|nr:rhomboid family intramembrane serine protease [Chthonomonadales bacterium]
MLIPYASDRVVERAPACVAALVLAHFAVYLVLGGALALGAADRAVAWFAHLGLTPASIRWYSPLTYFLLHEHVAHLASNMLLLWVFGAPLEAAIGWRRLLAFYVAAAVATGLAQAGLAALQGDEAAMTPIVGASGAVAAVAGVFVVRYYRSRIRFVGLPWSVPALGLVGGAAVAEIAGALWELTRSDDGSVALTARWAHLGGFALGMLWAQHQRLHRHGRDEYAVADAARSAPIAAAERLAAECAARPGDGAAWAELARAWLAAGDADHAADAYRGGVAMLLRAGRKPEALSLWAEMQSAVPGAVLLAEDQLTAARALEESGDHTGSAAAYAALIEHWPGLREADAAAVRLGELLLRRLGRREEAIEVLERFIADRPPGDGHAYAERLLAEARDPA